jgi:outer membrane autotransporter protein
MGPFRQRLREIASAVFATTVAVPIAVAAPICSTPSPITATSTTTLSCPATHPNLIGSLCQSTNVAVCSPNPTPCFVPAIATTTLSCPSGTTLSGTQCLSAAPVCPLAVQTIATDARVASQVGMTAVQSQLNSIRDTIQRRLQTTPGRPLGYAAEFPDESAGLPDRILGYAAAKPSAIAAANPLYTKAPPAAAAPASGWAIWAQLYGDYEQRRGIVDGFDTGRISRTGGIIGGIDKVFTDGFGGDALVLGLLSGAMTSHVSNVDNSSSRINGPSVGAYAIWIKGGFSIDSTFKVDFLDIDQASPLTVIPSFGLTNYSAALNLNYKIQFGGWWMEPTLGVLDTRSIWNSIGHDVIGLRDGNDVRLQAGSRFGTPFDWGRASVEATLTALAYDDVSITGGTLVTSVAGGSPLVSVPTDEGKVFGQVIGKLNFDWSKDIKGLTSYVEGEVRGRSGVFGTGARVGVRYSW